MSDKPVNVLLIEDDPVDAQLIQEMLSGGGNGQFHLEWVDRLNIGLDRLAGGGIDVVLSDLKLPDSSGLETINRIHARVPVVPVVFLTGAYEDEALAYEAIRKGAQDYLVKRKIDGEILARTLRYAVERKRQDLMKDEFISLVSHELRTPLTIMREGLSQILEGICGKVNPDQTQVLSITLKNVDRLGRIISNLLDLSKLEAGKLRLEKDLVNLSALALETVAIFGLQAKEKGIEIRFRGPQERVEIYADRDKLTQVLTNLLSNALKFTEAGSIEVSIEDKTETVECSVTDTGRGISKEDLSKVFSKFQQFGHPVSPGSQKGTGLGLAITRGIVELHRGKIWIESTLGKGTRFSFSLPRYSAQEVFQEYVHQALTGSIQSKVPLSVFVVDIENYFELQEKWGRDKVVDVVHRLYETIKKNLRRRADMAVMDTKAILILLPETPKQDALAVAERIRKVYQWNRSSDTFEKEVKIQWAVAGYPEDGKSDEELFEKLGMSKRMTSQKVLLLVEDEPDQAQLVQSRLRAHGFKVVLAQDGASALQKAVKEKPDVILVDVMIPKIDGFETCRRLKSDPRMKGVPLILTTAYEVEDFEGKCRSVGADAWIKRPYESARLMEIIEEVLQT